MERTIVLNCTRRELQDSIEEAVKSGLTNFGVGSIDPPKEWLTNSEGMAFLGVSKATRKGDHYGQYIKTVTSGRNAEI